MKIYIHFKAIYCIQSNLLNLFILDTGTLANSEDPDEMLLKAAFHQGLHCLLRSTQSSATEIY